MEEEEELRLTRRHDSCAIHEAINCKPFVLFVTYEYIYEKLMFLKQIKLNQVEDEEEEEERKTLIQSMKKNFCF